MIFFKSTRPDGCDFYTGTVDYAAALTSGVPVTAPVIGLANDHSFPGPKWLHLATVPTECVGMSWPCRLFEVEPVGDMMMDNAHPHKIGARSVRVLREIEAHRVFGPQGVQVAAFVEVCATLTADDVRRLGAAWGTIWGATPGTTRDTIWGAAWAVARDARGAAWGAARDAAWKAAWGNIRDAWGPGAAWDTTWDTTRDAALDAALDAARGLLLRDLIGQRPSWDQDAYDLLTGPWRDVIGPIHPDDGDEGLGR